MEKRLRTTVVGSFPSTPPPKALAASYRHPETDPFLRSLEDAVGCQTEAGIDIISDGQTRNDMIGLFASKLGGIRMRTRPVVIGPVEFRNPITLDDLKFTQEFIRGEQNFGGRESSAEPRGGGLTDNQGRAKPAHNNNPPKTETAQIDSLGRENTAANANTKIKGIITGPYTLAMSVRDNYYGSTEKLAYAFAEALSREVNAISEAGVVDMVQVDEPFFSVEFPEYAGELVGTVFGDYSGERALHACGDVGPIFDRLAEFPVDILDHEFAAHPELAGQVADHDFPQALGYGCVRSDSAEVESVDNITERVKKGIDLFGDKELLLDPDCGLRNLGRETACQKLRNMVAAKEVVMNDSR